MRYFADNTTTCFTTHLSHEIRLNGEWCVGLAEIHIPCTIPHISRKGKESSYKFYTSQDILQKTQALDNFLKIPYGIFKNINHFVECVNESNALMQKHQHFVPSTKAQGHYRLERTCGVNCGLAHYTQFDEKIGKILGFDPGEASPTDADYAAPVDYIEPNSTETDASATVVEFVLNDRQPTITGIRPACLARAIPEHLFIYSDLCEPYAVGDTQAPLLRIVSLDNANYKFGATVVKHFAPIKYIPLMKNTFQNIIIDIRDATGHAIAFEYGTLTLTLHFKRAL